MSSKNSEASSSKRSLRERTRESFRKLRKENRTKINHSVGTAYHALREVKSTARQALSSVKSAVENISNKCLQGGQTAAKYRLPAKSYSPLKPVKLYSPFSIETPSPRTPRHKGTRRHRKPRSCMLGTPARQLRQDLKDISDGIEELNTVAEKICVRVLK